MRDVAWWRRRPQETTPAQAGQTVRTASFAVVVPPEMTQGGVTASAWVPKATRRDALSVPAVLRARNLICPVLGGLPLHVHGPDRAIRPNRLLDQPELGVPRSVTMTRLVEDLLFDEVAWWEVLTLGFDGFPAVVQRRDPSEVFVQPDGKVYVNGVLKTDAQLIRFDSPNPGLLEAAARAIRTCLLLDAAAGRYAAEPVPPAYFTPNDGADPDDEEVQAALDAWAIARTTRATGYVGSALKLNTVGMTPEQIQLAESRQHAVLEIARAAGLDAEDLGVSTTSRTYFNAEDRRQSFLDFTLGPYVSAIQDRLSMGDVTPRGSYVRFAFEGLLRTDTLSRYQSYALGLEVGALAGDEIRALEDKPDLTPAQRRAVTPGTAPAAPAPSPAVPQQGATVQQTAERHAIAGLTSFTAAAGDVVTLAFAGADLEFRADQEKRTVSGLLLPFNVPTSDKRRIRFAEGSVTWQKAAVSRIKLDREHDLGQLLGSATKVESDRPGVTASFKVARTPAGDEALALAADGALDGLSAVVRITDAIPDPANDGGTLVTAATLVRATLTADPAFDDARLSAVALTHEGTAMTTATTEPQAPAAPAAAPDTTFTAAVDRLATAVETLLSAPQITGREHVPAGHALGVQVTEPAVYSFAAGHGPSLIRDLWHRRNGNPTQADDAAHRLRKFEAQQAEAAARVEAFALNGGDLQSFATVNRTVGSTVIPPGYRPELYVPQLFQGRPLADLMSSGTITDATPFTVPRFSSATGGAAAHVEGTNPTDGTLTFGSAITVTPGAVSGRFRITREVIDAANPAIDAIASAAMREAYSQNTEATVYTLLNGANGAGGTITAGFVPSGAAVVAQAAGGTLGSNADEGALLVAALRQQIVDFPFRRFARPDRLVLSQEATRALAAAVDGTGRPLLPRIGATNASGTVAILDQAFDIDGLPGVPAWSITSNTAADFDTLMWNAMDAWVWESPLLTFRYEEVAGPANIDVALFGYFAAAVLRPAGFSAIRLTVT
jgi:phage head maturation protease